MRRRAQALLVSVVLLAGLAAAPAWGALPKPAAPVPLPAEAELSTPYAPQTSCEPRLRKGVKKFRALMLDTYRRGHDGGSARSCTAGGTSEHYEGRAWDWMLDARKKKDKRVAKRVLRWLLAPGPDGEPALQARRLGVMYVIWNHRIWGVWSGEWKRLSKTSHQHTDHIHFSFSWAGARGRTSFWTGKVAKPDYGPCAVYRGQPAELRSGRNPEPCPGDLPAAPRTTHALAWTGSAGPDVRFAQKRLRMPKRQRTGYFGTKTRRAVAKYQERKALPVTGALDQPTWAVLHRKSLVR